MVEIFNALMRSLNNLQDRRIWLRLAGPALASLLVWLLLAFFALEWFVAQLLDFPPLTWIAGWGALWLAKVLGWVGGWLAVFALAYLRTAALSMADRELVGRLVSGKAADLARLLGVMPRASGA